MREKSAELQAFHKQVVDAVNAAIYDKLQAEWPERDGRPFLFPKAFDATNDVGARLCRKPGSTNTKAKGNHREVKVVHEIPDAPRVTQEIIDAWYSKHPAQSVAPEQGESKAKAKAPRKAPRNRTGQPRLQRKDFRQQQWGDSGGTWQDVVDAMPVGNLDVVCPLGGTSVGSGFFSKNSDGRSRYRSNANDLTIINTYNSQQDQQTNAPPPPTGGNAGTPPPPPPPGVPSIVPSPTPPPRRRLANLTMRTINGNRTNLPQGTSNNLMRVLQQDSIYALWENTFSNQSMNRDEKVDGKAYTAFKLMIESDYNWTTQQPSKENFYDMVYYVASLTPINPVTDYLESLQWDGVSRVWDWVNEVINKPCDAAGVPLSADALNLYSIYGYRFLIGCAARALQPGCKLDTCLVIGGRQGFKKSTIFEAFCPEIATTGHLHCSAPLDLRSNDKYAKLYQAWIYEDAEMASGKRSDNESKKAFLSQRHDNYRKPYASHPIDVDRHTVMVGTTKDGNVLKDSTGSRRYWYMQAPQIKHLSPHSKAQPKADVAWIETNRDQLWAEAVALFKQGEQWWLTDDEDERRGDHNIGYEAVSPVLAMARLAFTQNSGGKKNGFKLRDFYAAMNDGEAEIKDMRRTYQSDASALTTAGFLKYTVSGSNKYYKEAPNSLGGHNDGLSAVRKACSNAPQFNRTNFSL
jgi:hypothetical protein